MASQSLFPSSLIPDNRLSRASSFSDFSRADKVVIKKSYQLQTNGNLTKQYSCEQVFDPNLKTSQVKFSQMIKSPDAEHNDVWETTIPVSKSFWSLDSNKSLSLRDELSSLNNQLALTGISNNRVGKALPPFVLPNEESKLRQSSLFSKSRMSDFNTMSNMPEQFDRSNSIANSSDIEVTKASKDFMTKDRTVAELLKEIPSISKDREKDSIADLKKRLRSLVVEKPKKRSKIYCSWSFIFIILLSAIIGYFVYVVNKTNLFNELCSPRLNIKNLPQDLKQLVYGQEFAVHDLIQFFTKRDNQSAFDALVFIGGMGVGKSYTAEIIKNNLKDTRKILDYYPPLHKKEDQVHASLSACKCNLVLLENLKTDDILDAVHFIEKLKERSQDYCVLVIAVVNTQELDYNLKRTIDLGKSILMIDGLFSKVNLQPTIVGFQEMSDKALTKCIEDAAKYSSVNLSQEDVEYVKEDLITTESGCKGAYAKVQLFAKPSDKSRHVP